METLGVQTNSEPQEELKRLKEENVQLKKELNQHQVIVNNTLDAIFICDNEMRIVQANEATERMLQVDSEDLKSVPFWILFSIPKDELNLAVKKFFKKGFLWKEVPIRLDGGATKYIEFLAKRGIGEDFFLLS